jgi:serine/threonine protein kinase
LEALQNTRSVADAVSYAHRHNVVHADLKPANVLLDSAGRIVVTDFGFARILAVDSSLQHARIGGTEGYIAPEVLQLGQAPSVSADIYGLGAMLWALATGMPPNARKPIGECDYEPIKSICCRCLDEEPRRRYKDVGGFLAAIDATLSGA